MPTRIVRGATILAAFFQIIQLPVVAGDLTRDGQKELYAARYTQAAELYRKALEQDSALPEAYYGLVRSLLGAKHAAEAYEAADEALKHVPETAGARTAAGLAEYRRGDLVKSEEHFLAALKVDPNYPGALAGMASIYSAVSRSRGSRDLLLQAYRNSPEDSALMLAHANTLRGPEHIAALQRVLNLFDPESREARSLRAHISSDKALAGHNLRRLTSPYEPTRIKLVHLWSGPNRVRGVGVQVRFNQRQAMRLLLDTGASGISLTPKSAEKSGLEMVTGDTTEMNGIGDGRVQESFHYIASEIEIGDAVFAEVPVSAFKSAKDDDFDGIIGADVFQRFVVTIDFPGLQLVLDPRPKVASAAEEEALDAAAPAAGFYRAMRFGNHLTIPTSVNQRPVRLFLIDSGSSRNLIDTATAREATEVSAAPRIGLRGVQGAVKDVSVANRISLAFAGFRQDNPDMIAFSLDKMGDSMGVGMAGVLGMPVLSQMKLTIDYRNGSVRFEHKK